MREIHWAKKSSMYSNSLAMWPGSLPVSRPENTSKHANQRVAAGQGVSRGQVLPVKTNALKDQLLFLARLIVGGFSSSAEFQGAVPQLVNQLFEGRFDHRVG